jgi:hypothetical protein
MLGQTQIITSEIQGLLQGRVADFLKLRNQLNEMVRSPVLTISDQANSLLVTQTQLEIDVPLAISKAQTGNTEDILSAMVTYGMMEKQIYDVGSLWGDYTKLGSSAKASYIPGIPNWVLYIAGGFVVWKMIRR